MSWLEDTLERGLVLLVLVSLVVSAGVMISLLADNGRTVDRVLAPWK